MLLQHWNNFPGRSNLSYSVVGPDVYIYRAVDNAQILLGNVLHVANWTQEQYDKTFNNAIRIYDEERKKQQMMQNEDAQDRAETRARKLGEKWGRYLLALNPNIPMDVLRDMTLDIADWMQLGNMRAAIEFSNAVFSKFANYQEANPTPRLIKSKVQTDIVEC